MPKGKTKAFYEEFLQNYTTDLDDADDAFDSEKEKVQGHLGPIFPQYGSVFLSFWSKKAAFLSYRLLQEEMTDLRVDVLPNINSRYLKIQNMLIVVGISAKLFFICCPIIKRTVTCNISDLL